METLFTKIINKIFKTQLELLYGLGSYVEVTDIKFCTQNKNYLITCKLYLSDLDLFKEVGEDGLIYILNEVKKYTGYIKDKFVCLISYNTI